MAWDWDIDCFTIYMEELRTGRKSKCGRLNYLI
jgi:hypothetical protein